VTYARTALFLFLLLAARAEAAETWDDVWKGLANSFALPTEQELNKVEEEGLLARQWQVDTGLMAVQSNDGNYVPAGKATLQFMPLGCWFAEASFFYYREGRGQNAWSPDFIYRFGCGDGRPYALSLIYNNYASNRSSSDLADKYNQGTYTLSWNLPVPDSVAQPFLLETDKKIGCKLNLLYSPRYFNEAGELKHDKTRLSLGFDAPVYGGWYLSFNLFYYLDGGPPQPWHPDYIYEVGWRYEQVSIAWKNDGGNRFPWRSDLPHDSSFTDGNIEISWHW
jgi:hypothetical protein